MVGASGIPLRQQGSLRVGLNDRQMRLFCTSSVMAAVLFRCAVQTIFWFDKCSAEKTYGLE